MAGPLDLIVPPFAIIGALATLPFTLICLPTTGRVSDLLSWASLKHAWFRHFWWWFGTATKPMFAPLVRPLISQAKGVVLDIGPASGIWMSEFEQIAAKGGLRKVYGIEPNKLFHQALRERVKACGLEGIYEPVAGYVQDLETRGVKKGTVDTIITVHVLCSTGKHTESLVWELYEYLKPGGQWIVYEHVRSKHGLTRAWQEIHNLIWAEIFDGCALTQNTEAVLRGVGEWESFDLGVNPNEGYFQTLPHTMGIMIKKK